MTRGKGEKRGKSQRRNKAWIGAGRCNCVAGGRLNPSPQRGEKNGHAVAKCDNPLRIRKGRPDTLAVQPTRK